MSKRSGPRLLYFQKSWLPIVLNVSNVSLVCRPMGGLCCLGRTGRSFQSEAGCKYKGANNAHGSSTGDRERAVEINRQIAKLETGLNKEKKAVLRLVLKGDKNIFLTGAAGTGKSHLLKKIIRGLEIKYLHEEACRSNVTCETRPKYRKLLTVGVTASTGLAAYNIGGMTLHRFTGVGKGIAPISQLVTHIKSNPFQEAQWKAVKVLIIDEISMISANLFDKIDVVARQIRAIDRPFGGVQLLLVGDFFQLPPVLPGADDGSPRFCFESRAWREAVEHSVNLTRIYRQKDARFSQMLNEIRHGKPSAKTIDTFRWLQRPLPRKATEATEPVELYPLRRQADFANTKRMARLPGATCIYTAFEGGNINDRQTRRRLLNDCAAPEQLRLKKGAQVTLIKNINGSKRLMNGTQGRVIGFASTMTFHHHDWENNPVDFAATLEPESESKDEPAFMLGDENGRTLREPPPTVLNTPRLTSPLYPVVRFDFEKGYEIYHCVPQTWTVERWRLRWIPPTREFVWEEEVLAKRTQVPLLLSWALSIHKAQGQSLELVRVDLGRVFESGHAYVALSRAKTLEGLQVLNFDPVKVYAHPKVNDFYKSLSAAARSR